MEEELKNLKQQDKVSSANVKAFKKEAAIKSFLLSERCQKKVL